MVVADSSVLIEYLNGNTTPQVIWMQQAGHAQRISITSLIFCEVLRGVRNHRDLARVRSALSGFHIF